MKGNLAGFMGRNQISGRGSAIGGNGRLTFLRNLLLVLVLAAGFIYIAPYLGSEPVRAAQLPELGKAAVVTKEEKHRKNAHEFFTGPIPKLRFEFAPEEWENLKKDHRRYVECQMIEEGPGGKVYKGVAVKLKGAAGSFQGPDGKPGLTVSFAKFKGAERFRGMNRFHLNNGVQDATYLNELIAGEIAQKAGVPASRCTHAIVKLNGRDVGLYVVKEGFTKDFISRFFKDGSGALYDGGLCREIDENMEKDEGDPKDRSDVKAIVAACREGDNAKRWARLAELIDIDRFLSYIALESLLCHWDGYNFNRNNYRIYFDPSSKKMAFFLHGMDQMFGDVNFPVMRDSGAMVGQAILSNPEWKKAYRDRVEKIYNEVLKPIDWAARTVEVGEKVHAALVNVNPQWAKDYRNQMNTARDRVAARIAAAGKQLGDMPRPVEFDKAGVMKLAKGWREQSGGAARIDNVAIEGKQCLHIVAGGGVGSWRKTLELPPGKYRFEAMAKGAGITSTGDGGGKGAGLRISGATARANGIEGDAGWKQLAFEFDSGGGNTVLVAELRASKGEVWFDSGSLQLVKVK